MLIETLILALFISLICRGKLSQLGQIGLREFWLVPLALLIQGGVYWAAVRGIGIGPSWFSPVLDTGSYFLLLIFTLRNSSLPGMRFITLGIFLNTLVIALNGGVMPVDPSFLTETGRKALMAGQGTHGLMTSTTHMSFLADRFYLDILGWDKQVFSVGDGLIDIGIFLLVFMSMRS
ncbi:MAG TPA: DUF5317 domain-containing protein, partial [Desulfosporosinus sp.]|nr:DUF5317 domain-containing protein [Desulfosporosinus sp.]